MRHRFDLERLELILEGCGGSRSILTTTERWEAMQCWRETFAAPYHRAAGKWKNGEYEWHIFSFKAVPALNGPKAVDAYLAEPVIPYFIATEDPQCPAFRCETLRLPNLLSFDDDVYVWGQSLEWTMAYTHEASLGLGPYFCRREWTMPESHLIQRPRRN